MGNSQAKIAVVSLLAAYFVVATVTRADAVSEEDLRRNPILHPLSDVELTEHRSRAFLGESESAYLVYEHLSANTQDRNAPIYLRLAAELGKCEAVMEIRNKLRNHEDPHLAARYFEEAKTDERTRHCFANDIFGNPLGNL